MPAARTQHRARKHLGVITTTLNAMTRLARKRMRSNRRDDTVDVISLIRN